jgi:menaquinone-9 beta-reductase
VADLHFSSQSLPGYCWFFPTGNGEANVGVGTLLETTPPQNPNPKELFRELISQDDGLKNRLANAEFIAELAAWPLKTYNPNLPLAAERLMLLGEAAGLVNPLNGEGIQYALMSGRWASQSALEALQKQDFSQATLETYSQRVETELGVGFRTSTLVIQLIRNRSLNPLWLKTLENMIATADANPAYAEAAGAILAGTHQADSALNPAFILATAQQATIQNTIKIATQTLTDPTTLPKNIIQITQTTLQTALNITQNPLTFIQWAIQTTQTASELTTHQQKKQL